MAYAKYLCGVWDRHGLDFSPLPVVDYFRGLNGKELINEYTLWLFNIAMGNGPFIDDFPIKTSIYKGFSMAMLNNQMVNDTIYDIFI